MSKEIAYRLKIIILQERMWLVATCLGLLCMLYFLITSDRDSALYFFGFFILSGLFFVLRKQQRKRIQEQYKRHMDSSAS
jgi:hypothetical protein